MNAEHEINRLRQKLAETLVDGKKEEPRKKQRMTFFDFEFDCSKNPFEQFRNADSKTTGTANSGNDQGGGSSEGR